MASASGYILTKDEGELRAGPGNSVTWFKASGNSTNGLFTLVEESASCGESAPIHLHEQDEESFYLLDGEITFFLGSDPGRRASAGSFVHIPRGLAHGFRIESEQARYLILTTPQHGNFYRAITRPVESPGDSFPPVTGDEIGQACEQFAIEFVGEWPDQ